MLSSPSSLPPCVPYRKFPDPLFKFPCREHASRPTDKPQRVLTLSMLRSQCQAWIPAVSRSPKLLLESFLFCFAYICLYSFVEGKSLHSPINIISSPSKYKMKTKKLNKLMPFQRVDKLIRPFYPSAMNSDKHPFPCVLVGESEKEAKACYRAAHLAPREFSER